MLVIIMTHTGICLCIKNSVIDCNRAEAKVIQPKYLVFTYQSKISWVLGESQAGLQIHFCLFFWLWFLLSKSLTPD